MWRLLWTANVRDWQKPLPHTSHLKGFSLQWMYLSKKNSEYVEKYRWNSEVHSVCCMYDGLTQFTIKLSSSEILAYLYLFFRREAKHTDIGYKSNRNKNRKFKEALKGSASASRFRGTAWDELHENCIENKLWIIYPKINKNKCLIVFT